MDTIMKIIAILLLSWYVGITTQAYCQDEQRHIEDDVKKEAPKTKDTIRIGLLKVKAEKCMNSIISQNFTTAAEFFDPRFKEDFSPDTLKKFWSIFKEDGGEIIEQTGIKDEMVDTSLSIIVTYLCKKGRWDFHLVFTTTNQISGLYVEKTPPPILQQ